MKTIQKTFYSKFCIILIAILIFLACGPLFLSGYHQSFLARLFQFIALAEAWTLFSGFTGYVSFGHHLFFGVGAYTLALFSLYFELPILICFVLTIIFSAIIAFLLGKITLKLKGHYFALSTLSVAMLAFILITGLSEITRGARGIILSPVNYLAVYYELILALAVFSILITFFIKKSNFGKAALAIKEDEVLASTIGIDTTRHKTVLLIISASIWAVAGLLGGFYLRYINPSFAFEMDKMTAVIIACMLGGLGSIPGTLFGVLIFSVVWEFLWATFRSYYEIILGMILVILVLFFPNGLIIFLEPLYRKLEKILR